MEIKLGRWDEIDRMGKVKREIVRMGIEVEMLLDEAEHGHLGSSQTQFRLHFRFRRNIAGLFQPEWQQGGLGIKTPSETDN